MKRARTEMLGIGTAVALAAGCTGINGDLGAGDDGGTLDGTSSGQDSGVSPSPVLIASGQNIADGLAVDDTSVYWTTNVEGTVSKAPVGGGPAVTLASGQPQPTGIAVDATSVYWANGDGSVMKAALDGSNLTRLAAGTSDPDVIAVAVDARNVYWTTRTGGAVMSVALGGGAATVLVSGENNPRSLAVDATSLYWADLDCSGDGGVCAGAVRKAPLEGVSDGGSALTLASGQPLSVALDAKNVYWTNAGTEAHGYADGAVMSVPIGGGASTTLAMGQSNPYAIAVDATSVYWTTLSGGVMSLRLAGGAASPTTLASGQPFPSAIALGEAAVFWTDRGTGANGSVMSLSPE